REGVLQGAADTACLRDVRGQERAKRALEIAAAGRHHTFLVGPPGAGKSMLAARLPGLLPPLTAMESLETSMIHSLAGTLEAGGVLSRRPYQEPHHTASVAAIVGGGKRAGPGQISLAHNGVLFMDEFPEFPRAVLETLRQPIETGEVTIARANAHVRYPCRFLLVAAANPCRCGMLFDPDQACSRAPTCGEEYMGKVSGPLMDRFDLRLEVPAVEVSDLALAPSGDASAAVADRVAAARAVQAERYACHEAVTVNADLSGDDILEVAAPDGDAHDMLLQATERFRLSARGYHRVLKVARTIADLDASETVRRPHLAEALAYRLVSGS
ncbi:MAG: YifB family Mg chelatase-like AAA ATPase, partial [Pseudomonadota bacterium]